jgi:hypothetical protein
MALFFNLQLLESESGNDEQKFLKLLKYYYDNTTVVSKYENYKPLEKSLKGNSFLINPRPVLYSTDRNPTDLVNYIKLAGRRDLLLYKNYKILHLDRSLYPDINIEAIKYNPLLTITNNHIKFKYEESKWH